MGHDSKAEVWDCTCDTISTDQWAFMEDGGRICGSGFPIWRVQFLSFVNRDFHNWVRVDIYAKD